MIAHLAILATALVVLLIAATREWFFYDDWYYLTTHPDIVWAPHVGHWNTIPVLVLGGIQRVFGMDHYLPFAVPAVLAHLGVVHLVWRLSLRAGVRPATATAFTGLLAFLGAGAEAIDWAVQLGFVGSMTAMLGVILLLDTPRLGPRRGLAIAALVLAALASSEVSLPFLVVAVVLAWRRFGVRRTLAVFAVPIAAFGAWFVVIGHEGSPTRRLTPTQVALIPQFVVSLLSDGVGRMLPLTVLGGLLVAALLIWWMFTLRRGVEEPTTTAYLLVGAGLLFALITAVARVGNGLASATSSRYVYVVVIALAPLLALGFDRLTRRAPVAPTIALVAILAVWNAGGLEIALTTRVDRSASTASQLAGTAATLRADPGCLAADSRPSPQWAPDVTVADVERWLHEGWYHPPVAAADDAACTG